MGWRETLRAGQGHLASERLYLCVWRGGHTCARHGAAQERRQSAHSRTDRPLGPWPGDPLCPHRAPAPSGLTRRPERQLLPARHVRALPTPSLDLEAGPWEDGGSLRQD